MPSLKAFIVEDSPVIRASLIAALEELVPLKVVGTAEDEQAAVGWLDDAAHECDIAIVDIFLRHGSGLGVLRALQHGRHRFDRVVLTNFATDEVRRQCLALGASRVFDKSSEIDALIEHCLALAMPAQADAPAAPAPAATAPTAPAAAPAAGG
jgi:DNA-binding NarL/FixJ family response regulator